VLAGIGCLTAAREARADVQACLQASERGQRSRRAGKLREAHESFLVCGADSCPTLVRRDCVQWNTELAAALPTVVFGAKDKGGRDLFNVTVSMDGEVLVSRLDGKSVTVDPGKHVFKFEASGFPAVTETTLVKEGERARSIDVVLEPSTPPPVAHPAGDKGEKTDKGNGDKSDKSDKAEGDKGDHSDADSGSKKGEGGHTPYPWIMVGIGAVGVAVGAAIVITTPARPANCNPSTLKCVRLDQMSDADFRLSQEQAGAADSQPFLGYILGGGGLALVAGGLLWHFLEPTGDKPAGHDGRRGAIRDLRIMPWSVGYAGGMSLDARF
jgi:hypothetical protein